MPDSSSSSNLLPERNSGISCSSLFKIAGLCVVFSAAIFFTQDQVKFEELFSLPSQPEKSAPQIHFETVDLAETIRLFNTPECVFLDVRPKQYYDYGHIERAESVPIETISQLQGGKLEAWRKAPAVVIYCNGTSCGMGFTVAKQLMAQGLDNVKIYTEGWPEWRSCRLPIAMSEQMKADESKRNP